MKEHSVKDLLPWYVNNTLSEDERKQVEALLESSEEARQELAFLQSLSQEINTEELPEFSELGWRRLQKNIKSSGPESAQGEFKQTEATGNEFKRSWWMPGIAAAALVVMTLQIGIFTQMHSDNETRLLSQEQPSLQGQLQEPHWIVQLEFNEEIPWGDIVTLLDNIDARVIDGPSSIGLIRVAIPESSTQFSSKDAAMSWLQQQPAIIHAALEDE